MFERNRPTGPSPFHRGERRIQERLGARDVESWAGRAIRGFMPDQHREFFSALPFVVVSARDRAGRPWATLLEGDEGFVTSPEATRLRIAARPVSGDALEEGFALGADLGVLGIEPATRRRNRVNGRVLPAADGALTLAVDQSFGNCPQHIRERRHTRVETPLSPSSRRGKDLNEAQMSWIAAADTFFIASGYRDAESSGEEDRTFGMDVSHRGGEPGFVEVVTPREIRFPDFAGNRFYNTLGNILLDPRAGLLFIDFSAGRLLQLTGRARIDFGLDEDSGEAMASRTVTFAIEEIVEVSDGSRLRWEDGAGSDS
ncbi:pyridoxamine 5'-phosphate oxidase family protein [Roseibium aggregatum]|uniref:Pyridoxamine 5'-phosphate oxidase family protein n=1 Tax=Roseibium aggregatum TaxID=187304 RepID=A0A939J2B1_9HYPH|nr:pyridoxamine 5'-phosphate oxidase family protein [Roseibium aggregatum]MBN9671233.1 pyridoxamine 5'-phosphate oxidase family protein [Roseibium aggregatum]